MTRAESAVYPTAGKPGSLVSVPHLTKPTTRTPPPRTRTVLPGLGLCVGAAGIASGLGLLLPGVSPLMLAIILGTLAANMLRLPAAIAPGVAFSSTRLLRAGIVLLGLKLALTDIMALGAPMLVVVVCIVAVGIGGTVLLGRLLKVPRVLTLLIACGFSICGAAAVAATAGVTDPDNEAEEDTVAAVALVVIFGTLMIPLLPLAAQLLHLPATTAGLWAGGSIHEIAQVVAAGGAIGGGALTVAVMVKLARVLLLAPVIAILSVRQRYRALSAPRPDGPEAHPAGGAPTQAAPPPIIPSFVIGFLAMVVLRSSADLPPALLGAADLVQTWLLTTAMFALGCGIRLRSLARTGIRPFALAALSTLLVSAVALVGVLLANP